MTAKNPTMRDTKETILAAYKAQKTKLQELASQKVNPTETVKAEKAKATVSRAKSITGVEHLEEFKTNFNTSMVAFIDNFGGALGQLSDINKSIRIKEEELQDLFGIEREAFTLASLMDAQRMVETQYFENLKYQQKEAEERLNDTKTRLNAEIANLRGQTQDTREELETVEERTRREFEYTFSREKLEKKNALDDMLDEKRKEYSHWKAEQTALVNDEKEAVSKRESAVQEAEQELTKLRETVENMPTTISERVKAEVGKQRAILENKLEGEKNLLVAQHDGQINLLNAEKDALQKTVDNLTSQLERTTSKLDEAYARIQGIASESVKGAGQKEFMTEIKNAINTQTMPRAGK